MNGRWRRVPAWVGPALLCCGVLSSASAASESATASHLIERPDADLLLLSLRLDQSVLAETLPAYANRGGVLVPLGEVCRLLGLGILVDVARGTASGFVIDERRRFALDVAAKRVLVAGTAKRFDAAGIEIHQDDIYVDAALLSEWLPLRLDVDLYAAVIAVHPQEKLPLESRLERERQLGVAGAAPSPMRLYPRLETPYRQLSSPFVDQTLRLSHQPSSSSAESGANRLEYSTYATGDLLLMSGSAFLSGTEKELADARFSLTRKDPEGGLLGPLGARDVTLGDVFHPGLDLIALPSSGPGLLVSNFPLQLQSQFDRQSFRGELPAGWEVELYRGAELLAYAQSRSDGLYEFLDVPLLFGLNVFRLELYGPQGQRRSETQRYNVGQTLTPKGAFYYRLAGAQPKLGLAGTAAETQEGRSSLDLSLGLTRHLSASGSVAQVQLEDRAHQYAKVGLRGYWHVLFANFDVATDRGGGSAWQATAQSRLGALGLQLQHAELHGFESEAFFSPLGALRSRTALRFDGAIPESWLPRIPLLLFFEQDRLESGERTSDLSARVSAFRRGLAVANQVTWTRATRPGVRSSDQAAGQLLISKSLRGFALRGEVDYAIEPNRRVTSLALTADRRLPKDLLLTTGASRASDSGETRILAGLSRQEGAFALGVFADYSNRDGFSTSALVSVSAGRDPRNGVWHAQARPLASSGALSARVFLDANGNGSMDGPEAAIPGAGLLLNGSGRLARTDGTGTVFLSDLPAYQEVGVTVATATLDDPLSKPASAGIRLVPRPGKVAVLEFPIVIAGEIYGTVFLRRGGADQAASGIELELVDRKGVVQKSARTAYDGYYAISDVAPGGYTLSVKAAQVARLRVQAPSREVRIVPSGTVIDGLDFVLETAPAAIAPVAAAAASPEPAATAAPAPPAVGVSPLRALTAQRRYAVQVASFQSRPVADAEVTRLVAVSDRPVELRRTDLGAKGVWYRVYVGGFENKAQIAAYRRRVGLSGTWAGGVVPMQ